MTWIAVRAFLRRVPGEVWAVLLMLAAGLLLAVWAYGAGAASRAQEIGRLDQQLAEVRAANRDNQATITRLQEVNRELAEGRAADREAAARAVAEVASERDALAADLERRRADRGVIYREDPTADAWARARVPAAVADRLRD